jgi:hypothetical protein
VIGNLLRHFKPTAILHVSSDTGAAMMGVGEQPGRKPV